MSTSLDQHVANATIIREFVNHPGMKLLVDALERKIDYQKHAWLNAKDANEAESHRQTARTYAALMGTMNEFAKLGEQAQKALNVTKSNEPV